MDTIGKTFFARRVISCELAGFALTITLIWLDELIDLPHLLFGAEATPVNWREALFETLVIIPIALTTLHYTRMLFRRMKYLEGFLPICSSCKRIRDEHGNWRHMECYIHDRSAARFSHGLCLSCAKKLYPDVFTEDYLPGDALQPATQSTPYKEG